MKSTYPQAMKYVYVDEGGYSNDVGDPGGPTNYGITINDARMYWKADATAQDVRNMPKDVAANIYQSHYATPLNYDNLPAGVDYAVLDYGIISGISRSAKVLQRLVGVTDDGIIGPITLEAVSKVSPKDLINKIYDERLSFLRSLHTWSIFGRGWNSRCVRGRKNALAMISTQPQTTEFNSMNFLLEYLSSFVDAGHIGGWVRSGVAAAGGFLAAKYGIEYFNDPTVIGAVGTTLTAIVVGLWSSLAKTTTVTPTPHAV